jgi:glycosyltransferase involved in cell wall biosynthesis
MNVYADIRCLQDARFAFRGVGIHASTLLAAAKEYLPKGTNVIGLVSPEIGRLDSSFLSTFDSIESAFAPRMPSEPAAFLQMSPMTHDPTRAARLIGRSSIFSASVIYDFIPYDMPERYLADAKSAQDYKLQLAWLPSYDCFFPISQYSARRLKNICSISDDRITTTGVALRPDFESTLQGPDAMLRTVLRPSFPNRYVVCVAGADRRKNVEVLLDAHAKLPPEHNSTHVVIVGSYGESHIAQLIDHYESQGGLSRKLHFLHGVSDAELKSIYAGAVAAVCCSEIEGFSIPVI